MSVQDLVEWGDLEEYPGGPFNDAVIDAAVANVRGAAGWHIAPSKTETITVDSPGGTRLVLDTLHLTAVSAVRDVCGATPVAITDFRWSKAGILYRRCGWPRGFQVLEVDIVHGYEVCPPELLPSIAAACQSVGIARNVASSVAGPFQVTYRDAGGEIADPVVSRYALPSRP